MLNITQERSSGYSILSATKPYDESISSEVPVKRLSKKIEERLPDLPLGVYGCIESKEPNAHIETSPPLGAFGFT